MKYKVFEYSYEKYLEFLKNRNIFYIGYLLKWNTSPQGYDFWYSYKLGVKPLDEEFYEALDDLAIDQGWPLREESPLNKKLEGFIDDLELKELFM